MECYSFFKVTPLVLPVRGSVIDSGFACMNESVRRVILLQGYALGVAWYRHVWWIVVWGLYSPKSIVCSLGDTALVCLLTGHAWYVECL